MYRHLGKLSPFGHTFLWVHAIEKRRPDALTRQAEALRLAWQNKMHSVDSPEEKRECALWLEWIDAIVHLITTGYSSDKVAFLKTISSEIDSIADTPYAQAYLSTVLSTMGAIEASAEIVHELIESTRHGGICLGHSYAERVLLLVYPIVTPLHREYLPETTIRRVVEVADRMAEEFARQEIAKAFGL